MPDANRGEVWLVDLGLAAKIRPCLVMSVPTSDSDRSLVTLIAHTTSVRNSQFEVKIMKKFLKAGVFDAQNLITIPDAKLLRKIGSLAFYEMAEVENAVRAWLGL